MTSSPDARLLHDLLLNAAERAPEGIALRMGQETVGYGGLVQRAQGLAGGLQALGLQRGDRVAVYLPKSLEAIGMLLAASMAGLVIVPVNPVLRARQVGHLLRDSGARVIVSSPERLDRLSAEIAGQPTPEFAVVVGSAGPLPLAGLQPVSFEALQASVRTPSGPGPDPADLAALFYTSGSTGLPRGVMISHANLLAGARSVGAALGHTHRDRLLLLLPLSFDAGFNILTSAFLAGAELVLADYILARDALERAAAAQVTGITGVPPLWRQLADAEWPEALRASLRYWATTGGVMPQALLGRLRQLVPRARPYLMYGFTEAFRATILPPDALEQRPTSVGVPIPGAELHVLRPDGSPCAPGEPGELVQAGPHVAQGYWANPEASARRFRQLPGSNGGPARPAVWSGDIVTRDTAGFFYFHHRRDELIKTSGYRVSPTEVETALLDSRLAREVVVVGIPDPELGQVLAALVVPVDESVTVEALLRHCRRELPAYMVPRRLQLLAGIPRGPNGKYDRIAIRQQLSETGPAE